jgi:TPR repeat protein
MSEIELKGLDIASLDKANADVFYQLGILYSAGGEIPADYVTAHKWFNIAASRGNAEASRLRREIAEQMSEGEVATAQRAARDWLKANGAESTSANVAAMPGNVLPMQTQRHAA